MLIERSGRTKGVAPTQLDLFPVRRPPSVAVSFCTLASSSGGNCSILRTGSGRNYRLTLIDCGLSPRRTRATLATLGLDFERIDDVLLTHLDHDHCHRGWAKSLPSHARFRVLDSHRWRAKRARIGHRRCTTFVEPFELACGARVTPCVLRHDELGVAAFRFDFERGGSLGYATDLGQATPELAAMLGGVDVLAVESNYCPELQAASDRPAFVKDRITGGSGHLSNDESAALVYSVAPTRAVVLLHLSRQCNTPEVALRAHAGAPCDVIAAPADEPSAWIELTDVAELSDVASPDAVTRASRSRD